MKRYVMQRGSGGGYLIYDMKRGGMGPVDSMRHIAFITDPNIAQGILDFLNGGADNEVF